MNQPATNELAKNILGQIQMLVPSSFAKKFGKSDATSLTTAMNLCLDGLSQGQITQGLTTVREMGFCPDPALFRRWCLGLTDFENTIAATYIGKHGALAKLTEWLDNPNTTISTAIKQAYDETYPLWRDVNTASDRTRAEMAFKDSYEHIVNMMVANKQPCQDYIAPIAVDKPKATRPDDDLDHHRRAMADMRRKAQILNQSRQAMGLPPANIIGLTA